MDSYGRNPALELTCKVSVHCLESSLGIRQPEPEEIVLRTWGFGEAGVDWMSTDGTIKRFISLAVRFEPVYDDRNYSSPDIPLKSRYDL